MAIKSKAQARREIKEINHSSPEFPPLLKEIPSPPASLFVLGNVHALNKQSIAIVGTRKASHDGVFLAKKTAKELAEQKIVIVSGFAFGIDAAAHEGALKGDGETVAVLACGLDNIYPREHFNLAERVLKNGGCVVSEYTPGTPALPHQFLERNRIVSGLSIAVIIIEAPKRSGAISTARHAAEQGRDVFVFPGHAFDRNYDGSHSLIRNGARLVSTTENILEDLGIARSKEHNALRIFSEKDISSFSPEEQALIKHLAQNGSGLSIDDIFELTKLEPNIIRQVLTTLTLKGIVTETGGFFFFK